MTRFPYKPNARDMRERIIGFSRHDVSWRIERSLIVVARQWVAEHDGLKFDVSCGRLELIYDKDFGVFLLKVSAKPVDNFGCFLGCLWITLRFWVIWGCFVVSLADAS